jgi:hypothetical protein
MHSTQQPSYAERNDDSRIGLGFNGIFQRSFKAASGFAGRLRSGIVNVLPSTASPATFATFFFASPNARPKSALEARLSAMGSSIKGGSALADKVPARHSFPFWKALRRGEPNQLRGDI